MGLRDADRPLDATPPRLPVVTGRAWTFADGLRASDILPADASGLQPDAAAARLFAALDPALAARIDAGDVLVAGQQLGGGAGGMAVARALHAAGIVAVVAASYAPGFADALLRRRRAGARGRRAVGVPHRAPAAHQPGGGHDRQPVERRSAAGAQPHRAGAGAAARSAGIVTSAVTRRASCCSAGRSAPGW